MSGKQVKSVFESLARSQGFYGRLLRDIEESDNPEAIYEELGEGVKDTLDLVLKMES